MKDVMKSINDLNKSDGPGRESTKDEKSKSADAGRLSGLDAIRQALESNLKKKREQKDKEATPQKREEARKEDSAPTLEKLRAALRPQTEKPQPETTPRPAAKRDLSDEQFANKLYMQLHREMEHIVQDIKNSDTIDPAPLLELVPDFCNSCYNNEYLFLKAIQRKRYATWVVSHSVNVAIFTIKIGNGLKYEKEKIHQLALAALLHDVGMVKVPNRVLFKHGKLSPAEFDHIRKHPEEGYEIVKHLKDDYPYVTKVVYQEHEREDGSGYPQGLKGDEISDYARIIGIADLFEALVHGRAYRDGFITYHAIQKIIQNKSKTFNPKFIRALVNSVSMFPVGSHVRLSSDEIARVISVNKLRPVRPIVEIVEDAEGRKLPTPQRVNLEEEPLLYITKPIVPS